MKSMLFVLSLLIFSTNGLAQFAGPAGSLGSTAIHKDSAIFVNWASNAQIDFGWLDISNPQAGTTSGDPNLTVGIADGSIVSLGDSGVAILTFPQPIANAPGPDFAVFENAFSENFLELAFVEVSSDGINFYRFPATSNTQTETQIGPFDALGDATLLNNLAGKYRANFGTPFDLAELDGIFGLNIMAITHVKIIDVVGVVNGNHVQLDSNGNPINDPYPTSFPAGGFDLDAIGVIHQGPLGLNEDELFAFTVYPNPVQTNGTITVSSNAEVEQLTLLSATGTVVSMSQSPSMQLNHLPRGVYLLQIRTKDGIHTRKVMVR